MIPPSLIISNAVRSFMDELYVGFIAWPISIEDTILKWADVADLLLKEVVPPSTTSEIARNAFISQMSGLNYSSDGRLLLQLSFQAYATELALGMAPAFTGVPPPLLPPFFFTGLITKSAKIEADNLATVLVSWAKTGVAIPVFTGPTINWS